MKSLIVSLVVSVVGLTGVGASNVTTMAVSKRASTYHTADISGAVIIEPGSWVDAPRKATSIAITHRKVWMCGAQQTSGLGTTFRACEWK